MKAFLINSVFLCLMLIIILHGISKGQEPKGVNFFHVIISIPNERGIDDRNDGQSYFSIQCNPFKVTGDSLFVVSDLIYSCDCEGFVLIEYNSPIRNIIYSDFAIGYLTQDSQIPFYSLLDSDRTEKIFSISYDQIVNDEGTNLRYTNDSYQIVYSCFGQESVEIYQIQKYKGLVYIPVKSKWKCY